MTLEDGPGSTEAGNLVPVAVDVHRHDRAQLDPVVALVEQPLSGGP
ncbi:hypothetical protein [Embleya sp. MST-111070]